MRFNMGSDGECDEVDDLPSSRGNQWKGPISRKASQTSVYLQEWDIPFEQLDLGELIGKVRNLSECISTQVWVLRGRYIKCLIGARAAGVGCTRVGGTVRSPSVCSRLTATIRTIWSSSKRKWWTTGRPGMRTWSSSWVPAWLHPIWPSSQGKNTHLRLDSASWFQPGKYHFSPLTAASVKGGRCTRLSETLKTLWILIRPDKLLRRL